MNITTETIRKNKLSAIRKKRWRKNHPELAAAINKLWRENNSTYLKEYRINHRKQHNENLRKWRGKHPEFMRDYNSKHKQENYCHACANKNFPEPQECEVEDCLNLGVRHHDDYNKPLEIRWLCTKHHAAFHWGQADL